MILLTSSRWLAPLLVFVLLMPFLLAAGSNADDQIAAKAGGARGLRILRTQGKIERKLRKAQQILAKRPLSEQVLKETKEALHMLRDMADLQLDKLTVVQESPRGLGMFTPSPRGEVRNGKLLLYVEVRNFISRKSPAGWSVDLGTDAVFYYADGSFIARKDNIGRHSFVARTRHDVTFMVLELNLHGMPAQVYEVELLVHDNNSGKSAKMRCYFKVLDK